MINIMTSESMARFELKDENSHFDVRLSNYCRGGGLVSSTTVCRKNER